MTNKYFIIIIPNGLPIIFYLRLFMELILFICCSFQRLRFYFASCGIFLLPFVLSGCMSLSTNQELITDIPDTTMQSLSSVLKSERTFNNNEIPIQWWDLFNDSTLVLLESDATKSNLDLLSAVTRIEESRIQLGLIDSSRNPLVSGVASYSRQALSEHESLAMLGASTSSANFWNFGLQAGWELDLWGHLRQQSQSAQANLEATIFGMKAVKVSVTADVARTYLLLRGVEAQIDIYQKTQDIAKKLVSLIESRKRNGVDTRFEVTLSLENLAKINANLLQFNHQRDIFKNALSLLLGKYPRELDNQLKVRSLPVMPRNLPIGISSELASKRPDIMQAEAHLRAAVSDIGVSEADFYPRVSLTGSLNFKAFEFSDVGGWDSRHFAIGPTVYLPIFEGGRLKRNLELSTTRHRLAVLNYQKTVLNAWHEINNALDTYSTELKRYKQLQLAFEQRENYLSVANHGYDEGTLSLISVLKAENELLNSKLELIDCATSSALSVVSLYRSLSANWSSDLEEKISTNKAK